MSRSVKVDIFTYSFVVCCMVLLLPHPLLAAQEEKNIQKSPDYWCPNIVFVGRATEIFKLEKCEYISGITIKLIYNGRYSYPVKLKFTLLDSKGKVMEGDKKKRIFGPRHLEKGQYGIFTIQRYGNNDPALIKIEGVWEENIKSDTRGKMENEENGRKQDDSTK